MIQLSFTKIVTKYKRPLMTSQLHRLWCFFAYVSQLTRFLSIQKNTINGAAVTSSKYVVLTLIQTHNKNFSKPTLDS